MCGFVLRLCGFDVCLVWPGLRQQLVSVAPFVDSVLSGFTIVWMQF